MRFKIKLNTIEKVKEFSNICSQYDFNIDVFSGRYIVDGKSTLGLFSLDLTKELIVKIDDENINKIFPEIKKFIEI